MALSDKTKHILVVAMANTSAANELSAAVDASTTSTAGSIHADGSVAFTADQSMGSHKLTNLTDPASAQDAATKAYVDKIIAYSSNASAGGGTSETLTVTGLAATDTILAVSMETKGATGTSVLNGYGTPSTNALPVTYTADPGAGLIARVLVKKA